MKEKTTLFQELIRNPNFNRTYTFVDTTAYEFFSDHYSFRVVLTSDGWRDVFKDFPSFSVQIYSNMNAPIRYNNDYIFSSKLYKVIQGSKMW